MRVIALYLLHRLQEQPTVRDDHVEDRHPDFFVHQRLRYKGVGEGIRGNRMGGCLQISGELIQDSEGYRESVDLRGDLGVDESEFT